MNRIEIISKVWSIQHKATLVPYLIAFALMNDEIHFLMRRKDIYNAVKTIKGGFYIREIGTETYRSLEEYYMTNDKINKELIQQYKEIEKHCITLSDDEYNGWKSITILEAKKEKQTKCQELSQEQYQ